MTGLAVLERELSDFAKVYEDRGLWAVATHCLYPSNNAVTAFVTGGPTNGYVVSDDGGAVGVWTDRGIIVSDPDRLLKQFCVSRGLHPSKGAIVSRQVPADAVVPAIIMVANAASEAALWGVHKLRPRHHRDVKKALRELLSARYSAEHLRSHVSLTGESTRQYTFDHMVAVDGRQMIVDAVAPDGNSVNARTIAHIDVARKNDPKLIQRIVYDEQDEWKAADLHLMQTAAPLVQLGSLSQTLDQLRAQYAH